MTGPNSKCPRELGGFRSQPQKREDPPPKFRNNNATPAGHRSGVKNAHKKRGASTELYSKPARKPTQIRTLRREDVARETTGLSVDPIRFVERQEDRAALAFQERVMVDKMRDAGVDLRREGDMSSVDLVTMAISRSESYRACRFLASIAASERRADLQFLEMFLLQNPSGQFARYGVVTGGSLIPANDPTCRSGLQHFHRRLSRWASEVGEKFGIDVVLRATEFTRATGIERFGNDDATPLYHFHANVLYIPRNFDPIRFRSFLSWTHAFFRSHWSDAGKIKNIREIVKYMIKPADLVSATGEELVWLFNATSKLKMVQALGELRLFRKTLCEAGKKVSRIQGSVGPELILVKKQKRPVRPTKRDEIERLEGKRQSLLSAIEREGDGALAYRLDEQLREIESRIRHLKLPLPAPHNMIVCVLPPSPRSIPFLTPAVMVAGLRDVDDFLDSRKFQDLRNVAMDDWHANNAPSAYDAEAVLQDARARFAAGERSSKGSWSSAPPTPRGTLTGTDRD